MKFTKSTDGVMRTTMRLEPVRLSEKEIERIRNYLKEAGKKGTDKEVRGLVSFFAFEGVDTEVCSLGKIGDDDV